MNIRTKTILCLALALVIVAGTQVFALAGEDDIFDEADIYLGEFQPAASNSGSLTYTPEGNSTSDISRSPAVSVDVPQVITIDQENTPMDTEPEDMAEPNPVTGAPAMALPIGTVLLCLGCIPILYKKK